METFPTLAVVSLFAALAFLLYGGRYVQSYLPYEQMCTRDILFICFHHSFSVTCFGDLSLINSLCLNRCELEIIQNFVFIIIFFVTYFGDFKSHRCPICLLASGYLVCMCYSCIQFSQCKAWTLAFPVLCVYMFVRLLVLFPHPVPSLWAT